MGNDLRLQVILDTIDKATAPLRQITKGSLETAQALKDARDRLKELNTQQKDVSAWRELQAANRETAAALEASNAQLGELSRATAKVRQQLAPTQALVEQSRQKFDALKDTQGELKRELTSSRDALGLVREEYTKARSQFAAYNNVLNQGNALTDKQRIEYEQLTTAQRARKVDLDQLAAKEKTLAERYTAGNAQLRSVRAGHANLREELRRLEQPHKTQLTLLRQQTTESKRLGEQYGQQKAKLASLGVQLRDAGINTNALGAHELKLKRQIENANQAISTQSNHLETLRRKQEALTKARTAYDKTLSTAGNMAASGAAGLGVGYAATRPVAAAVKAFAPNEDSATQLKVSMMDDTGKVSEDFRKITDLATRLGDRLPGTTAEFQEMMTMLRRQGLSAQSILGGTGEAAAYLGVQLRMPVTEAAEFAAKMQDATRTSEKDMMALMDTIQRGFYMGVDSGNMLQGFSKISPVMDTIKKSGLEAANHLAPLLVMMDQAGMEGGSAGNAFRKIFQAGLDKDNIKDVNKIMEIEGKPIQFKFTDSKGNFAGLENLYAQIEKIKVLNDEDRDSVIKSLFGNDSETVTVLNTMINKGLSGYQEIQQKLQRQADLRKRVNEQLQTLSNVMEAAEGSFTNAMAEFGAAVAPELKELITTLGETANKVGAWARENPRLAGSLVKVVALVGALAFGFGGLALTMASLLGPFAMLRYGMTLFGIKGGSLISTLFRAKGAADVAAKSSSALGHVWGGLQASAGGMAERVKQGWLKASPSELIEKFKELPGNLKATAGAALTWSKTAGPRLGASLKQSAAAANSWLAATGPRLANGIKQTAQATWAYATGPLRAVSRGLRAATASAIANIRVNGLLGGSYNMLKGGMTGLLTVARGGVVAAIGGVAAGVRVLAQAFMFAGRALLLNPIGLLISAIAVSALLIYKYWEPIKAFVSGFWQGLMDGLAPVKQALLPAFTALGNALAPLKPLWDGIISVLGTAWGWFSQLFQPIQSTSQELQGATESGKAFGLWLAGLINLLADLTGKMFGFGANLVGGLINGIASMGGALKDSITGVGDSAINWFKEKLGIHSPSRVFAALGGFTMAGLTQGLQDGAQGPLDAITRMGKQLTSASTFALNAVVGSSDEKHSPAEAAGVAPQLKAVQAIAPTVMPSATTEAETGVLATLTWLGKQITTAGAMALGGIAAPVMAMGVAAAPSISIDNRAPISPPAPVAYDSHDRYEINIHPTPGMDAQAVARAVRSELMRIEREKSARNRSRLKDQE